jgi:hypothetical protein
MDKDTVVYMGGEELPKCDTCHPAIGNTARYDAKTRMGQWAHLCPACWHRFSHRKLGSGFGHKLITRAEAKSDTTGDAKS